MGNMAILLKRLSVLEHRCLRSIAGLWRNNSVSNAGFEHGVLDVVLGNPELHRLYFLEHVLCMAHRTLFLSNELSWAR